MEEWQKAALRACELKKVMDAMEMEYDGLRKRIQEDWGILGKTEGEIETTRGVIKLRIDSRTKMDFDADQVLHQLGYDRFMRVATVSEEKVKSALKLGLMTRAEFEGTFTEKRSEWLTIKCP